VKLPLQIPDISTKERAQNYLGFDMVEYTKQKAKFKEEDIPKWEKQIEEREKERKN